MSRIATVATMLHHQPQVLSPLVETHTQSSNATSVRPRKMSAAGNRSWSEEEENYLLQTRLQKMPYKHIAAHLEKTELACRLHYHQLSHGSHRRRRNSSVSSTISTVSVGQSSSSSFSMAADHDDCTQSPRQRSPVSYTASPHARSKSDTTFLRAQHKILLPRPQVLTPRVSPEPHTALRIDTEVAHHPQIINTDRLRAIYEARRHQFWAAIAADYGSDVSPAQLEHLWRNGANTVRPPTPDASPDGTVLYNPILKPSTSTSTSISPFTYPSPAASEQNKHYSPMQQMSISAVSAPERTPYMLPMPVPSTGRPRAGTWSSAPRDNMPIASLLTEDKNPRDL